MAAVTRTPRPEPAVLWRRLTAEFLGSGFLAAVVIGGIAGILIIRTLYPAITPAAAADVIVPHLGDAGRAPAWAASDGALPSADYRARFSRTDPEN